MTDNLLTATDIRPGTYHVDPTRSTVRFTATHVFGLKPVDGTMIIRSGTVTVADEPRRSTASATIDASTFATDNPKRDRDIRSRRFLDVENHPIIGFRSTRLATGAWSSGRRGESGKQRTGGGAGWQIVGVLSVRGGSSEVTLDVVEIAPTVDGYRFTATTTIDRVAAGVGAGRAIIGRTLHATLTLCVSAA